MARGLLYWQLLHEQKCVFQLWFHKCILQSILIIEINHMRHLEHVWRLSGPKYAKYLHFGLQTFRRKIKSMESNRNMKFTHNVDEDMIKLIYM